MLNNKGWDSINFTDPVKHSDEEFIYLVHSIVNDPFGREIRSLSNSIENIDSGRKVVNFLINPGDLYKKSIICCSLIGNGTYNGESFRVTTTYSPVGLILKVPHQNIIYSDVDDLGTDYSNPDEVIKLYSDQQDKGPFNLLFNTDSDCYNEVIVRGATEYGSVEVVGVFLNCFDWDYSFDDLLFSARLAKTLGVNVTRIFEDYSPVKCAKR